MSSPSKRFRVALSFPGERRPFIEGVAARLAMQLGRDRVLYDAYYEAEFARPNLDTHLQGLYHDQSELIAVFLCEDYERKEWCGLEWRAIRDLIKKYEDDKVMLFRFDAAEIRGSLSIDGFSWIGERSPAEVADIIVQRLQLRDETGEVSHWSLRRVAPTRLTHSADRLFGREAELAALDAAWTNPATHVVTLVAWGGVGKTSLVAGWTAGLAARDYDGAGYFDWSFYSQGTREAAGPSADPFVDAALRFFGDEAMADSARSPWDKGARLAQRVAERPTLLVLDGLEPLQYPPGPLAGELKDPAMTARSRDWRRTTRGCAW